jgi:peroxiredoxin
MTVRVSSNAAARAFALAAAGLLSLAACGCGAEATPASGARTAGASPAGASAAPDFSLKSTDDRMVHLTDYLGKNVVLIDFWSTTCNPCMAEMPYIVDLYKAKKDKGFVVLAISLDGPESLADVKRVMKDKGMIFPVLLDEETTVVSRYNPKKDMPFAVLIDRNGNIVHRKPGYTPGDEKVLAEEVEKALK